MTGSMLRLLLLLSFPLLGGLGAAGLLIANAERRQKSLAARIAQVQPHGRRLGRLPIARDNGPSSGVLTSAVALFGCKLQHSDTYPVRWWIVPLGMCLLGRLAAGLAMPLLGLPAWLLVPACCVFGSRPVFTYWETKRRDQLQQQLPDALATIVRSVRVGIPVPEAIRLVGRDQEDPTGREFRQLADALSIGVPLDVALRTLAARTGLADYRFFATTVGLQSETGGTLGEALDNLAEIVRRRIALRARGYALTSEIRASAVVLCAMPFFAGGMIFLMTPGYIGVLFSTAVGQKMLGIAALSMTFGVLVMRGMVRKVLT